MSRFAFTQSCRPRGNLRIDDIVAFMDIMQEAFGVRAWVDPDEQLMAPTGDAIETRLKSGNSEADLERFGAILLVKSEGEEASIIVSVGVGGGKWSQNYFNLDFTRSNRMPALQYFEKSIELIRPYEASIVEVDSDRETRQRLPEKPHSDRPRILQWFHYMNDELVDLVGGTDHCLTAPVFRVQPFCDGLLFQLTEETFDADNPRHQELQLAAMNYLGLD